jgi:methyl-accepting chemotaxis protein
VRKLAERSKVAAEEIVSLAVNSLELAQGAGVVMMEVIPKIEKTTSLVHEISAASLEQNNGAGQVNNAIQQLNSITQQNASSSEELATSAEQLAGQAEQLRDSVSFFNTGKRREKAKTKPSMAKHSPVVKTSTGANKSMPTITKRNITKTHGVNLVMDDIHDKDFENF